MTEIAKIPKSVKISNVKTVFVEDSLCILHYDFEGKNSYGVPVKNKEEFVYLIGEDGTLAYYHDIDENESVLESAKESYQEDVPRIKEEILNDEKKREEHKRLYVRIEAQIKCLLYGYKVGKKDDSDSEYNISNW